MILNINSIFQSKQENKTKLTPPFEPENQKNEKKHLKIKVNNDLYDIHKDYSTVFKSIEYELYSPSSSMKNPDLITYLRLEGNIPRINKSLYDYVLIGTGSISFDLDFLNEIVINNDYSNLTIYTKMKIVLNDKLCQILNDYSFFSNIDERLKKDCCFIVKKSLLTEKDYEIEFISYVIFQNFNLYSYILDSYKQIYKNSILQEVSIDKNQYKDNKKNQVSSNSILINDKSNNTTINIRNNDIKPVSVQQPSSSSNGYDDFLNNLEENSIFDCFEKDFLKRESYLSKSTEKDVFVKEEDSSSLKTSSILNCEVLDNQVYERSLYEYLLIYLQYEMQYSNKKPINSQFQLSEIMNSYIKLIENNVNSEKNQKIKGFLRNHICSLDLFKTLYLHPHSFGKEKEKEFPVREKENFEVFIYRKKELIKWLITEIEKEESKESKHKKEEENIYNSLLKYIIRGDYEKASEICYNYNLFEIEEFLISGNNEIINEYLQKTIVKSEIIEPNLRQIYMILSNQIDYEHIKQTYKELSWKEYLLINLLYSNNITITSSFEKLNSIIKKNKTDIDDKSYYIIYLFYIINDYSHLQNKDLLYKVLSNIVFSNSNNIYNTMTNIILISNIYKVLLNTLSKDVPEISFSQIRNFFFGEYKKVFSSIKSISENHLQLLIPLLKVYFHMLSSLKEGKSYAQTEGDFDDNLNKNECFLLKKYVFSKYPEDNWEEIISKNTFSNMSIMKIDYIKRLFYKEKGLFFYMNTYYHEAFSQFILSEEIDLAGSVFIEKILYNIVKEWRFYEDLQSEIKNLHIINEYLSILEHKKDKVCCWNNIFHTLKDLITKAIYMVNSYNSYKEEDLLDINRCLIEFTSKFIDKNLTFFSPIVVNSLVAIEIKAFFVYYFKKLFNQICLSFNMSRKNEKDFVFINLLHSWSSNYVLSNEILANDYYDAKEIVNEAFLVRD